MIYWFTYYQIIEYITSQVGVRDLEKASNTGKYKEL